MIVITALENFKLPDKSEHVCLPYESLNENFQEWIRKTTWDLLDNATENERFFEHLLRTNDIEFEKQLFFQIDGKSYFLDFYIPKFYIAIEIDGNIHKSRKSKKYDRQRDYDFHSIGIETYRFTNEEVEMLSPTNALLERLNVEMSKRKEMRDEFAKIKKEVEEEWNQRLHEFDNMVDLSQWHHVDEKPTKTKRYIILRILDGKCLTIDTAYYNAEQDWWNLDHSNFNGTISYTLFELLPSSK